MAQKMKVTLVGGSAREPEIKSMRQGATIDKELPKHLERLSHNTPLLIEAPPGSGKTYAVIHSILQWAQAHRKKILFVSSRRAINLQFKRALAHETNQLNLLNELTDEGLRVLEDFECVTVVTYHRLYWLMQANPQKLKEYGVLVFDEVHALLDDALFVSCTGFVLYHLREQLGSAKRIYMSATPQDILPLLADAECPLLLRGLRFQPNYKFVKPFFFQDQSILIDKINADTTAAKWLIFVSSIAEGKRIKDSLGCSVRLLNSKEREKVPEEYNTILKEEQFQEKVCIATALVDAGVNFKDPNLKNIVVFTTHPNTIVQFLGRKRRTDSEKVNLFVWCPSMQDLNLALQRNESLTEKVDLYYQKYSEFLRLHVLPSLERDLRDWVYVGEGDRMELNPLVPQYLKNQHQYLEKLIQQGRDNKGDCKFDRVVAQLLHIRLPDRSDCWLDPRFRGTAKAEFESFLVENVGKDMGGDDFTNFCKQFQALCVTAFGSNSGKDRTDRDWRFQKINNKLAELDNGYILKMDRATKVVRLELIDNEPDNEQGGEQ